MAEAQRFRIAPLTASAFARFIRVFPFVWAGLPATLLLIGLGGAGLLRPSWHMPWGLAAVLIAAGFLLPAFMVSAFVWSRTGYVEIDDSRLVVKGVPNGFSAHLRSLRLPEARAVDLRDDPLLRQANGIGVNLPGLLAGSGSLVGGERIAWLVTDVARMVYVPALQGHSVLVSVASPEALVAALRALSESAEAGGRT
jgi:hypothetical protein